MNILTIPGGITFPGEKDFSGEDPVRAAADKEREQQRSAVPVPNDVRDVAFFNNKIIEASMTETGRALIRSHSSGKNVRVTDFDVFAAVPAYDGWMTLHYDKPEARSCAREHVRRYLKKRAAERKQELLGLDPEVIAEMAKIDSRRVVGCTVNVSALGKSPTGPFDMNQIIYSEPNGCYVSNRRRNSASRLCIRPPTPMVDMPEDLLRYTRMKSTSYVHEEAPSRKRSSSGRADDGESTRDTGIGLFACTDKPKDQTFLVYPSGAFVLTGAQDSYTALYGMLLLIWMLACEGMHIDHMAQFSPQNIVTTFRFPHRIDLKALKSAMRDELEFLNKRFPAAIFHPDAKNIERAEKRARELKKLHYDIVTDRSWMGAEERAVDDLLAASTACYETEQLDQRYEKQILGTLSDSGVDIEEFEAEGIRVPKHVAAAARASSNSGGGKKKEKFLAVIIHSTGAIVITGVDDPYVELAFYEIMYEKLSRFVAESGVKKEQRKRQRLAKQRQKEIEEGKESSSSSTRVVAFDGGNSERSMVSVNKGDQRSLVLHEKERRQKMAKRAAEAASDVADLQSILQSAKNKSGSVRRRENLMALGPASMKDDGEEEESESVVSTALITTGGAQNALAKELSDIESLIDSLAMEDDD